MANLSFTLGGVPLNVNASNFQLAPSENATNIRTLQGNLYTDFISYTRQWVLEWPQLCKDDYDDLFDLWDSQFSAGQYLLFVVPYYSVSTLVKMSINEKDIKFDGDRIINVKIVLDEQVAIS